MPKFHDRCQLATEELMSQWNLSAQEAGDVFLYLLRTQGSTTSLGWFTDSLQGLGIVPSTPADSDVSSGEMVMSLGISASQADSVEILGEAKRLLGEIFTEFS